MKDIRRYLDSVISHSDTKAGKFFDVVLLWVILFSVAIVMIDSVEDYHVLYAKFFEITEWILTVVFTVEFFLRIYSAPNRLKYVFSFYGIIDLVSVLPGYLSFFVPGMHYLLVIRVVRLLRVFRILKLIQFTGEAEILLTALYYSRRKIVIFLGAVLTLVIIIGSMLYVIEGESSGYTSIPRSIYWAIVTVTTVGYGDIAPVTPLGQFVSSILMILGYAIIAVPTGIVTVEMGRADRNVTMRTTCHHCKHSRHDVDAIFCKKCGEKL